MSICTNHPTVSEGITRCARCGRPFCPNCVIRLRGAAYCVSCKGEQVRDIQSGTTGELELAPLGRRFGALWIDSFLFGILGFAGVIALVPLLAAARGRSEPPPQLFLVLLLGFFAAVIVYEGVMLQLRGQTLGKMALGIKVVTPDGDDISPGQAWGRAVLRQVFFSYFALINYLPAAFTKQKTCIHDLVLRTRVVRVRR